MSETPILHADIGGGKRRRLFLGAGELRIMTREAGRGGAFLDCSTGPIWVEACALVA